MVGLSPDKADAARNSIGAASQIASDLGGAAENALVTATQSAFLDGFGIALGIAAAIAFVGEMIVLRFMPSRAGKTLPTIVLAMPVRERRLARVPIRIDE